MGLSSDKLPVSEKFISLQGEGLNLGKPYYCNEVSGCPLRCNFCDSEYTWNASNGNVEDISLLARQIWAECNHYNIDWVSITGGEPLIYPKQLLAMMDIWQKLSGGRIKVHIETSGRYHNPTVHNNCDLYSVDAKTPCTGESIEEYFKGFDHIRPFDQVKCLIHDRDDFDYAYKVNQKLDGRCIMILQPFNNQILTDSIANMDEVVSAERVVEQPTLSQIRRHILVSHRNLFTMYQDSFDQGYRWKNVAITPQVHVLTYGNKAGT